MQTSILGELVRTQRKARGWSQWDLAVRIEQDQAYISKIESAGYRPGDEVLARIADVLGIPLPQMLMARAGYYQIQEEDIAYDGIEITAYGKDGKERMHVRVLPEWLTTRAPQEFFALIAADDQLAGHGILADDACLFERVNGTDNIRPGTVVAIQNAAGERSMTVYEAGCEMTGELTGRFLRRWNP